MVCASDSSDFFLQINEFECVLKEIATYHHSTSLFTEILVISIDEGLFQFSSSNLARFV